jgi:ABC-type Zn2+ transport system substrate-binding protein/surface adhesin
MTKKRTLLRQFTSKNVAKMKNFPSIKSLIMAKKITKEKTEDYPLFSEKTEPSEHSEFSDNSEDNNHDCKR